MPRKEKRETKDTNRNIEVVRESAATRKFYQTVKRFRKGFQPRLNACKDNSGKLIEGDDKILNLWARYFKTQFETENSEEENNEEVFLTAEPLVKEPTQEEMEKATANFKTNKAHGEEDIITELIKNTSRELKKRLYALMCNIRKDEMMPDGW